MEVRGKLDCEALGYMLYKLYLSHLKSGADEYSHRIKDAIEDEDSKDLRLYSKLLSETTAEIMLISEMEPSAFLAHMFDSMEKNKKSWLDDAPS